MSGRTKSFVVVMTLTEIAFLMFFLLLFSASKQLREEKARVREEKARADRAREDLREMEFIGSGLVVLQQALTQSGVEEADSIIRAGALNQGLEKAVRDLEDSLGRQRRTADSTAEALTQRQEESDSLRKVAAALEAERRGNQVLADELARQPEEFQELVRSAARNEGFARQNEELRARIDTIAREREKALEAAQTSDSVAAQAGRMSRDNENLRGQIQNLQNRLGRGGLDHPPCWADPVTGKIEYMYRVSLREDALSVEAIWPAHREDDVRDIPGAHDLIGVGLSREEFREKAEPIFLWGKGQNPECRHFVRINDLISSDKVAFKSQLLMVEDYFYKYLPSD